MTAKENFFDVGEKSVREIFEEHKFFVPKHQRGYRWNGEQVDKIIEDIKEACDKGAPYYFIGPMTLIRDVNSDRLNVIDGQQRLTTLMFVLKKAGVASSISNDAISFARDKEQKTFDSIINDSILKGSAKGQKTKGHELMTDAADIIGKFLIKNSSEQVKYIDFLQNNVKIISIICRHGRDAYKFFASLNFDGKRLGTIDLIRNHICMVLDDEQLIDQCHDKWEDLEALLRGKEGIDGRSLDGHLMGIFTTFFECHEGRTVKNENLFEFVEGEFKETSQNKTNDLDFFSKIVDISDGQNKNFPDYYLASIGKDFGWWNKLADLQYIGYFMGALRDKKIFRAPIAATLHALNRGYIQEGQAKKLIHDLYSLIARTQLLGNVPAERYNAILSKLAKKIFDGQNFDAAVKDFFTTDVGRAKPEVLHDSNFIEGLKTKPNVASDKAKWLLRDIEFNRSQQNALLGKDNHAEHIYPEGAVDKDWQQFTKGTHEHSHQNRIGNFTLLTPKDNVVASNKPFAERVKIYRGYNLQIARDVAKNRSWSPKKIEERSHDLAKKIAGVWSFHYYP